MSYFERASRVWDPDPWTYSVDDTTSWRTERVPSLPGALRFHPPSSRDSVPNWGPEAEECSLTVWRKFYVNGDTIGFTMGRAPESCSEAPRIIWTDPMHRQHRRVISPFFNWNVDCLWCTENYLIFGLTANFEYGEHDERLGFWHLSDGRIVLSPGLVWEDSGDTTQHEASLPRRLPGWREARVAEMRGALVFTNHDTVLVYWPDRHAYSAGVRSKRSPRR